ncbi:hypothetical protein [Nocardioides convexus]|uniref:hypothetical protein n=1 Tax=Nocardioides convexus TaxID=2712224 RepID=UPI00241880DF|nr:hypothetical protein [Nocardioides convexus]
MTGDYGRRLSAVVIGFGATARGAVTALNAHGVHEVAVLTNRGVAAVASPIHSVRIRQFEHDQGSEGGSHVITERGHEPLPAYLAENDIIVNCTLQDTADPLVYLDEADLAGFRPGSLVVDVSCDLGMGFTFARPTSLRGPDVPGRGRRPLLRRRPLPVVPVELRDLGEQQRPDPVPAPCPRGRRRVGRRRDPEPGHRDPRGPRRQPRHPGVPATGDRASAPGRLRLTPRSAPPRPRDSISTIRLVGDPLQQRPQPVDTRCRGRIEDRARLEEPGRRPSAPRGRR